jgi:hypothetical protein
MQQSHLISKGRFQPDVVHTEDERGSVDPCPEETAIWPGEWRESLTSSKPIIAVQPPPSITAEVP